MQYTSLAKLYDNFTSDRDHSSWSNYICELLIKNNIFAGSKVLDICCGTGGKTYELYKKGYRVIGLDKSTEMLEIATNRFSENSAKIQLICQDILEINLHNKQDAIVCINDGINYISNLDDVKKVFSNIFNTLEKDGVFLFDISSEYKLQSLHDQSFFEENDDSAYIWHNTYNSDTKFLTMDISLYSHIEDTIYEKSNEVHTQRAHSIDEMVTLLKEVGFKDIAYFECFTRNKLTKKSERIQFVVKNN
ncbi:MAG: class I SAM-dependent methyltransferase [Desulfocapsa sp.]|nr:class I SAM-dependent methyltransferase [Desulfocapsa sp.]